MQLKKLNDPTLSTIEVIDYNPDHRYLLVISGDVLDKQEMVRLMAYLNDIGMEKMGVIYLEPGYDASKVINLIEIPSRGVLYYAKKLWRKITFQRTR